MGLKSIVRGVGKQIGGFAADYLAGKDAKRTNELARRDAKTFIQDRVADARAAGVHPLFALGAQYSGPSIVSGPDFSNTGNAINAIASTGAINRQRKADNLRVARSDLSDNMVRLAQIQSARSSMKRDEAQADMYRSEAALNRQRLISQGRDSLGLQPDAAIAGLGVTQTGKGLVDIVPNQISTRNPNDSSKTAGAKPFWEEAEIAPGVNVTIPRLEGEAFSENMASNLALMLMRYLSTRPIIPFTDRRK